MNVAEMASRATYLHIIRDEKFMDAARALFESVAPGQHRFVIVGDRCPLVHVKTFEPETLSLKAAAAEAFLSLLPCYQAVFIHGLSPAARWIVSRAPSTTRFVWIGWGGDYYHLIHPGDELLLPSTRALMAKLRHARHGKRWLRRLHTAFLALRRPRTLPAFHARQQLDRELRRIGPGMPGEAALLAKISLFAPVLPTEYELIREKHPGFGPSPATWNYDINDSLAHARRAEAPVLGRNVLLGNSATPENNHADAVALLGSLSDLGVRAVICPLGYGDASYADAICTFSRERLGPHFHPLMAFVPPLDYADLMRSCGIVIMNHRRQQALGTINAALCNGAKVFLRPENPLFAYYRRRGVRVFATGELPEHITNASIAIDDNDIAHARSVIDREFGSAALRQKTRALLRACDALARALAP